MSDDIELPDVEEPLDGMNLNYCPLHGLELENESVPPECPECGDVVIDFYRTADGFGADPDDLSDLDQF